MARAQTKLVNRLWRQLTEAPNRGLLDAIAIAEGRGTDLYLVGGAVRDLLLGVPVGDIDLVVEDNTITIARALGRKLKTRTVLHRRFGTAVVKGAGWRIDLARARTENYSRPGALPVVRPASLEDDVARRDFTINAMALRLTGQRTGELIDLHDGERDLAAGRVRILHDESFRDDPTRIFRALRYAGRFSFQIERSTARCLRRDLGYLDAISGTRIRRELGRVAVEGRVGEIVRLASRYGVLRAVHPALGRDSAGRKGASGLPALAVSQRDRVLVCLLLAGAPTADISDAVERLALTRRQAAAVEGFVALRSVVGELCLPGLRTSRAVELLGPYPVESLEALGLIGTTRAASRVRRYLDEWRFVRPMLRGRDLKELGIVSGPKVGSVLRRLRAARLDTEVQTRKEEVAFVKRLVSDRRGRRRG